MNNPKVSVLIPAFNAEKYIEEALNSILNQSFADIEVIVFNDGSTDGTAEILQSCSDPRVRVVDNGRNIGIPRSLNQGLEMARGEYINRMDADDISRGDKLEKQVAFLESHRDVGAVGTAWCNIDEHGRELDVQTCPAGKEAVHFMCYPSMLVRRECFRKVGGFREFFRYAHDYDLYIRISEQFAIASLDEPLYKYRTHGASISSSKRGQQDLYASFAIELAGQRKRTGHDRLETLTEEEALRLREQVLSATGIKQRKCLSRNFHTWGKAAFTVGDHRKGLYYEVKALQQYPFNVQAFCGAVKMVLSGSALRAGEKSR